MITNPSVTPKPHRLSIATLQKRFNTIEKFVQWTPNDGYKYEWVNGDIERINAMQNTERHIVDNLSRCFTQTNAYNLLASLLPETRCLISPYQVRIPDLAYFTRQQMVESANGNEPIPMFVIEIISANDSINAVNQKLKEYFDAGVQVVWHIFPQQQLVYVYKSVKNIFIASDDDMCTAQPALPDFSIKAKDIFSI